MAIAAVVLLSVGLLPQVSYAVTADDVMVSTESPTATPPADEVVPDDVPLDEVASDDVAHVEVARDESEYEPAETMAPEPVESDAGDATSPPSDDEYLSPLNGDYAGDVTVDEASPGGEPVVDMRSQSRSASPDSFSIQTLSGFRAGNIISDARLYTSGTLSVSGIQSFLNGKLDRCSSGYTCLKDFTQTTTSRAANAYCNKSYTGAKNETAAEIISKVAKACNISEKVLLVMLQKEQGLITHSAPGRTRYDRAMGFGCPDTGPGGTANCDPSYAGFGYQMYMAAYQLQRYTKDDYFSWFPVGKTSWVRWHPSTSCGSAALMIENAATAALYYYTPYQPNQAALNAGYGTGDSCSSYGNRNFYNYYTDWFGSTGSANLCEVPGNVKTARLQYVTTANLNARKAPSTGCADGVFTVASGTALQAVRATADETWIELQTVQGPRWMSREFLRVASAEQAACVLPTDTRAASREYVLLRAVTSRQAPSEDCTYGAGSLPAGAVAKATRVIGDWLQIGTTDGAVWIPRSAVGYATDADIAAACVDPAGTTSASRDYVVLEGTTAWRSPLARCGIGEAASAGSVVQATRVSASGLWLEVITHVGARWIARDAVNLASAADTAAACVSPSGASASTDRFILDSDAVAWPAPFAACSTGGREVSAGTVVQATRQSSSGRWIEIQTGVGARWIPADAATSCADPAGTNAASKRYIVRTQVDAVISPLADCDVNVVNWGKGTSPNPVKPGTVVQATRVSASGQWLEIRTFAGNRWVQRSAVETCADPVGTRAASRDYVVYTTTEALVSPLAECGTAPVASGTGTTPVTLRGSSTNARGYAVVQATRISSSGAWLEVRTQEGLRWVKRSHLRYATAGNINVACTDPAGTRAASKRYVVATAARGWVSPVLGCAVDSSAHRVRDVVQALRVSSSGAWMEVATRAGARWVPTSALEASAASDVAAACALPSGLRPATKRYVVVRATTGWSSPLAACGTGARTLGARTALQATRVSSSGAWLEVKTSAGLRWVERADVRLR